MTPDRLRKTLWISCGAGLLYFFVIFLLVPRTEGTSCLIRRATGYACPSCGVTRAIGLLLKGELSASLMMNPLGLVVAVLLVLLPIGMLSDRVRKRHDVYVFYSSAERVASRPAVFVTLLTLTLLNWIWNLCKFP